MTEIELWKQLLEKGKVAKKQQKIKDDNKSAELLLKLLSGENETD